MTYTPIYAAYQAPINMRANWDQQESTQIAVEHQQQHPQQPIVQEAAENLVGHPLHAATTPAWDSIADGIVVKPEPLDDKNNDSGISPGHYTSASASPESGSSQDSTNLPMNTFEYSPQIMYKQCDSPLDYARVNNTIDGYGMDNQHQITSTSPSNENMIQNNCDKEGDDIEEPGLRVPLVNSQGKMKTFRCKQCDFSAITKLEFWAHTRTHIKAEKLLTCPKCPFCTEYKHHLEYHLRNHFGSKPYKCDKCSYSCVNKSMLNSHLKSHSNVYQFRCADCTYATKYCHSLKLHLRKYEHKPAMVLNADGTPNPLPIIDVYGTRRGPKSKPKKEQEPQPANNNTLVNSLMPTVVPQQLAALGNFNFNVMNGVPNPTFNGFNGSASPTDMSLPSAPSLMGFPYHLFSGIQMLKENGQLPQFNQFASAEQQHAALPPAQPKEQMKSEPAASKAAPLDLSRPDLCENKTVIANESTPVVSSTVTPTVTGNSPKTGGTSRRKGRAFKLERRVVERESDDEAEHEKVQENDKLDDVSPTPTSPLSTDSKEFNKEPNSPHSPQSEQYSIMNMAGEFHCQYCEISFGNEVMHSVHMGYHGYQNPYTCNMCGTQCTDKVSFFLHIARFKH